MPINRALYPADWEAISRRIRFERAGGRCEQCGAVHGQRHPETGAIVQLQTHHVGADRPDGSPGDPLDKMDCRDENLQALCRRCHLAADERQRVASARITRNTNTHRRIALAGQLDLFVEE